MVIVLVDYLILGLVGSLLMFCYVSDDYWLLLFCYCCLDYYELWLIDFVYLEFLLVFVMFYCCCWCDIK